MTRRAGVLLVAFALVAVACGGDSISTSTAAASTVSSSAGSTTTSTTIEADPGLTTTSSVDEVAVTFESLVGIWQAADPPSFLLWLRPDGTYRLASTFEGLEDGPVDHGLFAVVRGVFTFSSAEDSENCPSDSQGIYELEAGSEEGIRQVLIEEECLNRKYLAWEAHADGALEPAVTIHRVKDAAP